MNLAIFIEKAKKQAKSNFFSLTPEQYIEPGYSEWFIEFDADEMAYDACWDVINYTGDEPSESDFGIAVEAVKRHIQTHEEPWTDNVLELHFLYLEERQAEKEFRRASYHY